MQCARRPWARLPAGKAVYRHQLRPVLPGGAVALDQICGPADAGNEGYGVDVRMGMMPPMSVSDGAGRMPAWAQVRVVAQHAETAGLDSARVCDHLLSGPPGQPVKGSPWGGGCCRRWPPRPRV